MLDEIAIEAVRFYKSYGNSSYLQRALVSIEVRRVEMHQPVRASPQKLGGPMIQRASAASSLSLMTRCGVELR